MTDDAVVTATTGNPITDVGATALADSLKTNSTLHKLDLGSTSLCSVSCACCLLLLPAAAVIVVVVHDVALAVLLRLMMLLLL